jgi:hypothetical protein
MTIDQHINAVEEAPRIEAGVLEVQDGGGPTDDDIPAGRRNILLMYIGEE